MNADFKDYLLKAIQGMKDIDVSKLQTAAVSTAYLHQNNAEIGQIIRRALDDEKIRLITAVQKSTEVKS